MLLDLGIQRRLSAVCRQSFSKFFGHIVRNPNESLGKLIVEGKIEGKSIRGRSSTRWLDQLQKYSGQIRDVEDWDQRGDETWSTHYDGGSLGISHFF